MKLSQTGQQPTKMFYYKITRLSIVWNLQLIILYTVDFKYTVSLHHIKYSHERISKVRSSEKWQEEECRICICLDVYVGHISSTLNEQVHVRTSWDYRDKKGRDTDIFLFGQTDRWYCFDKGDITSTEGYLTAFTHGSTQFILFFLTVVKEEIN